MKEVSVRNLLNSSRRLWRDVSFTLISFRKLITKVKKIKNTIDVKYENIFNLKQAIYI